MERISIETLRKLVAWNQETGILTWKPREPKWFSDGRLSAEHRSATWNGRYAGQMGFCYPDGHGYLKGTLLGKSIKTHLVIWALHYGEWSKGEIDHINGDRSDNRLQNLRNVSRTENQRNKKLYSSNASGYPGVCWYKQKQLWVVHISSGGKVLHLGYFESLDEAIGVRKNAEVEYGYHRNHGRAA